MVVLHYAENAWTKALQEDGKANMENKEDLGNTQFFKVETEPEISVKEVLADVYHALTEKGYNPVNQIVGYILSEDPTYITTYNNARSLIRHIDRDELLQALVRSYLHQ